MGLSAEESMTERIVLELEDVLAKLRVLRDSAQQENARRFAVAVTETEGVLAWLAYWIVSQEET